MRVSIIMATLNAAPFLPAALASLRENLDSLELAYEILLADGGSADETIRIASDTPSLRIVSHEDDGIYDGMNRCLDAATGEIVHILNSDDLLLPGALNAALDAFLLRPEIDSVSGEALFGTSVASAVARSHRAALQAAGILFGIPAINARFFRRRAFQNVGPFRTDIGLGADREWLLRFAASSALGVSLDRPVYFYRQHGASQTLAGSRNGRRRVYGSDIALADAILAGGDAQTIKLAQSLKSLAMLKLALSRNPMRPDGDEEAHRSLLTPSEHLARGLYLWARWRGVLSGF